MQIADIDANLVFVFCCLTISGGSHCGHSRPRRSDRRRRARWGSCGDLRFRGKGGKKGDGSNPFLLLSDEEGFATPGDHDDDDDDEVGDVGHAETNNNNKQKKDAATGGSKLGEDVAAKLKASLDDMKEKMNIAVKPLLAEKKPQAEKEKPAAKQTKQQPERKQPIAKQQTTSQQQQQRHDSEHETATEGETDASDHGRSGKKRKGENRSSGHKNGVACCLNGTLWWVGLFTSVYLLLLLMSKQHVVDPKKIAAHITGSKIEDTPGPALAREGLRAKHPVVFMPGIGSIGLELWQGRECAAHHFRERMWGGPFVWRLLGDPSCWFEHIKLDNQTGLDPPGIKLRPASGLGSGDYFIAMYYVWAPIIETLAALGYDESNMHMASMDWRLSLTNLEVRDRYYTRLKHQIELSKLIHGERTVMYTHSLGALTTLFFLKWVEADPDAVARAGGPRIGGNGGPKWVEEHIEAVVNIGPPYLGALKSVTTLLSGDMRDTANVLAATPFIADFVTNFAATTVRELFRTFGVVPSMLPKGGNAVWGDMDYAADDVAEDGKNRTAPDITYGQFMQFTVHHTPSPKEKKEGKPLGSHIDMSTQDTTVYGDHKPGSEAKHEAGIRIPVETFDKIAKQNTLTVNEALDLLREAAPAFMERMDAEYSHGAAPDGADLAANKYNHPRYWGNALETKLPDAPTTTMYCFNGVGIDTERGFAYDMTVLPTANGTFREVRLSINTSATDPAKKMDSGTRLGAGDVTVPLISGEYMCAHAWQPPSRFNPHKMKVIEREFPHVPPTNVIVEGRGTRSGDHIDIMGNHGLLQDIARVAAGRKDLVGERIFSNIREVAKRIRVKK